MKCIVVEQTVYEGNIAFIHGMGGRIRRIVTPDGLHITVSNKKVYVGPYDIKEATAPSKKKPLRGLPEYEPAKIIGEVDVPDDIIALAKKLLTAQEEAQGALEVLQKMAEQPV